MSSNFMNTIQVNKPGRSVFDLSHDVKMSGQIGTLYPVLVAEAVPGDTFFLKSNMTLRFAPMLAPIMHRCDVYVDTFFVPSRITWKGWPKFITGAPDAAALPYITLQPALPAAQRKFLDYMGINPDIPVGFGLDLRVNAIPFAAVQMIYDEYYRDENLIPAIFPDDEPPLLDGDNDVNVVKLATLRQRAWEKDYFTAALPFAQKGATIDIPLGKPTLDPDWYQGSSGPNPSFRDFQMNPMPEDAVWGTDSIPGNPYIFPQGSLGDSLAYDPAGSLVNEPTTINDLRTAITIQQWLELNMRAGTRYVEFNLAHFGVRSSDARLQRPEFISRVKSPVVISEVLNSAGPVETYDGSGLTQTGAPQGDMAGHGVAGHEARNGKYYCEEHGFFISLLSVLPRTAYQQGIPKQYTKFDNYDYLDPIFAALGEQQVLNKEIFAYGSNPDSLFGYMPRFAEYRTLPSRVAGDFRTSLDFWHMGRKFATPPSLSQQFIECTADQVSRVFAVTTGDHLWMHLDWQIRASRPLPKYGTPGISKI